MIKRIPIVRDSILTNTYRTNLIDRATLVNIGDSEPLEMYKIYGEASSISTASAKILLGWDPEELFYKTLQSPTYFSSYTNSASYGPQFILRLYDAPNYESAARKFYISASAVYTTRTSYLIPEGLGTTYDTRIVGVPNFETASLDRTNNTTENYWKSLVSTPVTGNLDGMGLSVTNVQYFPEGTENLEINVTNFMRTILSKNNSYLPSEILLALNKDFTNMSDTYFASNTFTSSSYKKCFHSRHYFDFAQIPNIEIRFDDSVQDRRGCFYRKAISQTSASAAQVIAFYNYHNGRQKVVGDYIGNRTTPINVRIYDDPISGSALTTMLPAGTDFRCGIYTASFALETTASAVYDRWFDNTGTRCLWTGSIRIREQPDSDRYVFAITNLKNDCYRNYGYNRFRVNIRRKNYAPQIYVKYENELDFDIPEYVFYKIERTRDRRSVIGYGSGSFSHRLDDALYPLYTRLSSDKSGSYFDLCMDVLSPDIYEVRFLYGWGTSGRDNNRYLFNFKEADQKFKFIVKSKYDD
jgi:hypothetical protein